MRRSPKLSGNFAAGVSTPFRADSDGGVAVSEGETYVEQLILTAMQANESDNPFQDLGITDHAIFKPSADPTWQLFMRRRIKAQIDLLDRENLARFVGITFDPASDGNGNFGIQVTYLNLETQKENSISAAISQDGDVDLRPT